MMDKLRALAAEYDMLPAGGAVLCAVSGGADSMCLLHLLRTLAPERGFTLRAAHFNHGLRGEEAGRDEAFVREICERWNIPLTVGRGETRPFAHREGLSIEEAARVLRYAFLEQAAGTEGCDRVATAHTADDNAETVLLHLVRGSGLQGLTGIPPRRGRIVRPLLSVTRAQVEEYCAAHEIPFVEDSTNADPAYTRNFLRLQVMPLLRQMNPRAAETLSAVAGRLRSDNEYLNAQAAQIADLARETPEGLVMDAQTLAGQPLPVASRAARLLLERSGGGTSCAAAHISALLALCRSEKPSGQIDLPGLTARRVYGDLVLAPAGEEDALPSPVPVQVGERTAYGDTGWFISCRRTVCPEKNFKNPDTFCLSCDKIEGVLLLRPRRTGDAVQLPGRPAKTLKKWMIDEKIPRRQRALLPVLADDAGVLAAASLGPDASRLARPGEEALEIIFERELRKWES